MSRTKPEPRPAVPAGDMAALTIGFEHLVVPAAVAYKLLPLLAKAIRVEEAFNRQIGSVYRDGRRLRVECKLIDRSALQLDKAATDEDTA